MIVTIMMMRTTTTTMMKPTNVDHPNSIVGDRPQSAVDIVDALMLIDRPPRRRVDGYSSSLLLQLFHEDTQ